MRPPMNVMNATTETMRDSMPHALHDYSHIPVMKDAKNYSDSRAILRDEAHCLIQLAIPITLAIFLELAPPTLTSMMIGQASGDDAKAVIAAGSLSDFFQGLIPINVTIGLGAAVATVCAHAYGANRQEQYWLLLQAGLLASAYAAVPITIFSLCGSSILQLLGQDPHLAQIAQTFILIGLASLPFSMVFTVVRSAFQAQNIAAPFVWTSLVASAVSLPIGYVLGKYTPLGYIGVALSAILGSVVKACIIVLVVLKNESFQHTWPGWHWRQAHLLLCSYWRVGIGSVCMTVFQSAGFSSIAILCGFLPNAALAIAASSIGSSLLAFSFVPMMGVSSAGTVRIANALGSGQPLRASLAAAATLAGVLMIAMVGILACALLARPYASAFTSNTPTIDVATRLVHYLLPMIPLVGLVGCAQAVFQACNAQWICAALNCIFLLLLSVGAGLVCAMSLRGELYGLWNGQMIGAVGMIMGSAVWYKRLDWQQQADAASDATESESDKQRRDGSLDMAASPDVGSVVFMRDRQLSSLFSDDDDRNSV